MKNLFIMMKLLCTKKLNWESLLLHHSSHISFFSSLKINTFPAVTLKSYEMHSPEGVIRITITVEYEMRSLSCIAVSLQFHIRECLKVN